MRSLETDPARLATVRRRAEDAIMRFVFVVGLAMLSGWNFGRTPCGAAIIGPDNPTITLEGSCPGTLRVTWQSATPDRWAVLWFSRSLGNFTLYAGICEGTELGLGSQGLRVVRIFRTGIDGRGTLAGRATSHACGGYVQVMENGTPPCPLSNVVHIPQ